MTGFSTCIIPATDGREDVKVLSTNFLWTVFLFLQTPGRSSLNASLPYGDHAVFTDSGLDVDFARVHDDNGDEEEGA